MKNAAGFVMLICKYFFLNTYFLVETIIWTTVVVKDLKTSYRKKYKIK